MSLAAAFDPTMAVALMSAASDPKAFQDRMAKLQAAMVEHRAVKTEAAKLKVESERVAKETAAAMAELARLRTEHGEGVAKAEQALMLRIQAADDRERDLARREEAHKAEKAKLSKDINDHARYRERDQQAHELKLAEVVRREATVIERESHVAELEDAAHKMWGAIETWMQCRPAVVKPERPKGAK